MSVIGAIAPQLERAEMARAQRKPTESLQAYDYYLRALASFYRYTREANIEAFKLTQIANNLDPGFAAPFAHGANCFVQRSFFWGVLVLKMWLRLDDWQDGPLNLIKAIRRCWQQLGTSSASSEENWRRERSSWRKPRSKSCSRTILVRLGTTQPWRRRCRDRAIPNRFTDESLRASYFFGPNRNGKCAFPGGSIRGWFLMGENCCAAEPQFCRRASHHDVMPCDGRTG